MDTPLYMKSKADEKEGKISVGNTLFNSILNSGNCFNLTEVKRQNKDDPEAQSHQKIIDAAMNGQVPEQPELDALERRFVAENSQEFKNAIKIVPTRRLVGEENISQLANLGQPIFEIPSTDEGNITRHDENTDFNNCEKNLYLCKNARITINANLNPAKGVFNSATGTVAAIITDEDERPKYLVVDLDQSRLTAEECFQGCKNRIILAQRWF